MGASNLMNPSRFAQALARCRSNFLTTLLCSFSVTAFLGANQTFGQRGPELLATYGRGVHEYFSGDTQRAEQYFTQVIGAGSRDPRAYYFRAMARLRMGRQYEAENDMRVGAAYEARNPGRRHSIGNSLQRVQGTDRRKLEKFRRDARLERVQIQRKQTQKRYEQLEQRGPLVLYHDSPVPLELLVEPSPQLTIPSSPSAVPPSNDSGTSSSPLPPQLSIPEQPPSPAPSPSLPDDDPFGSAEPVEDLSADSEDIFGTAEAAPEPAPAPELGEDDLFGGPAEEAEEGDLFGESVSPPVEEESMEEATETEEEEDPFGDPEEEDESAEDPFGDFPPSTEEEGFEEEGSSEEEDLFGSTAPLSPKAVTPIREVSKKIFFELGRWLGSANSGRIADNASRSRQTEGEESNTPFLQDPSEDEAVVPAAAEISVGASKEDDPFADFVDGGAEDSGLESVDDSASTEEPEEVPDDDPFADF